MILSKSEIELCRKAIESHHWLIKKAIEQKTWRSTSPAHEQLNSECMYAKEAIQNNMDSELAEFLITALDHHLHCHLYEWRNLEPEELFKLKKDVKTLTDKLKSYESYKN